MLLNVYSVKLEWFEPIKRYIFLHACTLHALLLVCPSLKFSGRSMDIILVPLIGIFVTIVDLYMWIIIVNVVLSWLVAFNVINTSNRLVFMVGDFCYRATEPLLSRIRQILPNFGTLDISPLVLILSLFFSIALFLAKVFSFINY